MFIAALLSLSCLVLHCEHIHCLIFVSCIYYYLSFFLIIFYIYRLLISFSSISPTFLSLLEYYIYNLSSTNSSPTCRSGSILGEFKIKIIYYLRYKFLLVTRIPILHELFCNINCIIFRCTQGFLGLGHNSQPLLYIFRVP